MGRVHWPNELNWNSFSSLMGPWGFLPPSSGQVPSNNHSTSKKKHKQFVLVFWLYLLLEWMNWMNGCLRALYHVHVMDRWGWRQCIILLECFYGWPTAMMCFLLGAVYLFWGWLGGGGREKKKRDSRYPLSFSLFLWLCDTPCLPKVWQIIFHNHWLPPISHIWFSLWHCESIMVFIQNSEIIQSQTQFNSSPVQFIKILESTQYIIKP